MLYDAAVDKGAGQVRTALRARSEALVDQTLSLAATDPSRSNAVQPIAGGTLVLWGPGLYVNRLVGAGITTDLSSGELAEVIRLSDAAGVPAVVEVTSETTAESVRTLSDGGFVASEDDDVSVLTAALPPTSGSPSHDIVVRPVSSAADLSVWQDVSAHGWGRDAAARQASDAFVVAVHATEGEELVLAFDASDNRSVGCASTTVRGQVAILGGMSTLPAERRRGVQAALLHYRMMQAASIGCELAFATTEPGSGSERNLIRHGFVVREMIRLYKRG